MPKESDKISVLCHAVEKGGIHCGVTVLKYGKHVKNFYTVEEDIVSHEEAILSAIIVGLSKIKNTSIPTQINIESKYLAEKISDLGNLWKMKKFDTQKELENRGLWCWMLDLSDKFDKISIVRNYKVTSESAGCLKKIEEYTYAHEE